MADDEFVALVPMKEYSERIPHKNLREMHGRPLCGWILETLSQVPEISRIAINTDSERIAEFVQRNFDVSVHWRPPALCGDDVSMNRIIEDDLKRLPEHDLYVQTHATNPLLRRETVQEALRKFVSGRPDKDSLFSVTAFQDRFYCSDGRPLNHSPAKLQRTQDLEPLFMENSNLYVFSQASFCRHNHRIGERAQLFEMNPVEAIDIDEEWDWRLAEALLGQQ